MRHAALNVGAGRASLIRPSGAHVSEAGVLADAVLSNGGDVAEMGAAIDRWLG